MAVEPNARLLGHTESVCPVCLQRLSATRVAENDNVYLQKVCPAHGLFKTIIWRGEPSFESWANTRLLSSHPAVNMTKSEKGCPFECGLCPEHRQHSCCVLIEVTQRCNLACPVCFADSTKTCADPSVEVIKGWLRELMASSGPCNIQLSGGEPTVRDDLPEIVALVREMGFGFVQINSNGLRLADDKEYVRRLKDAGLGCVFMQFDGISDDTYRTVRGAALFESKAKAIANCAEHNLGVVLVPVIVPGVNTNEVGRIIGYAIDHMPTVRGVHFLPISYFGRFPHPPTDRDRITLPEIMSLIESQTGGRVRASDLRAPEAENAYCSFQGNFHLTPQGELKTWNPSGKSGCCSSPAPLVDLKAADPAKKAREFVARRWAIQEQKAEQNCCGLDTSAFDDFLQMVNRSSFCISGMAFQDAWTLDLDRLRDCFLHVVSPDSRVIPFCAYNLTSCGGESLYRPKHA